MCRSGDRLSLSHAAVRVEFLELDGGAQNTAFENCGAHEILPGPALVLAPPELSPGSLAVDHPDLHDTCQRLVVVELAAEIVGACARGENLHHEQGIDGFPRDLFAGHGDVGLP